jgi:hypothetical protein
MGFIVTHPEPASDLAWRDYDHLLARLLLKQGAHLDRVPRTPENGAAGRWLYVWDSEADARAFAEELRAQTEDSSWQIQTVDASPDLGPLNPIEVNLGRFPNAWVFELHPLTRKALQVRYPGSCPNWAVTIRYPYEPGRTVVWQTTPTGVIEVITQVLPLLTGLNLDQLGAFGHFHLVDPVTGEIIVPATPLGPHQAPSEPGAA